MVPGVEQGSQEILFFPSPLLLPSSVVGGGWGVSQLAGEGAAQGPVALWDGCGFSAVLCFGHVMGL